MEQKPFIPPALPPKIRYETLIPEIGNAHRELGNLNGLLLSVPNPRLLIAPLLTKEAVFSSRIEGTVATIEDVFQYEAEGKASEKSETEKDVREILNYREAVQAGMEDLRGKTIDTRFLLKLHAILLSSVRGAKKNPGAFRKTQVYIAPPGAPISRATFIPPPPDRVADLLKEWQAYLNGAEKDPIVQTGIAHYQFEAIHPFTDGNGRIGRLLIPLSLYARHLLSHPALYVSAFFEEHRSDYYACLHRVSTEGAWEEWLRFFLRAVAGQSLATQQTILKMVNYYDELKVRVSSLNSRYGLRLLDFLFANPKVSFVSIREHLHTGSNQTVYNLLAAFCKMGILEEPEQRKRNRVYVFRRLLELMA